MNYKCQNFPTLFKTFDMGEKMGKSRNIGIQEMAVGSNILQRINAVWAQSKYVTLIVGYSKIATRRTLTDCRPGIQNTLWRSKSRYDVQSGRELVRLYYQNGEVTEGPVGKWASSGPMLARNRPVKLLPLMTGMLEGASQPMRPNPTTERSLRNQSLLKLFTQTSGEKTHTPNCHQHKP